MENFPNPGQLYKRERGTGEIIEVYKKRKYTIPGIPGISSFNPESFLSSALHTIEEEKRRMNGVDALTAMTVEAKRILPGLIEQKKRELEAFPGQTGNLDQEQINKLMAIKEEIGNMEAKLFSANNVTQSLDSLMSPELKDVRSLQDAEAIVQPILQGEINEAYDVIAKLPPKEQMIPSKTADFDSARRRMEHYLGAAEKVEEAYQDKKEAEVEVNK